MPRSVLRSNATCLWRVLVFEATLRLGLTTCNRLFLSHPQYGARHAQYGCSVTLWPISAHLAPSSPSCIDSFLANRVESSGIKILLHRANLVWYHEKGWINSQNAPRFRGGLVFKAHRLLCHSTLGLRVMKSKKKSNSRRPLCGQQAKYVLDEVGLWRPIWR